MQKKKFSIPPILFLYYEESACPLLLNFNKVYFASSLIAKPTIHPSISSIIVQKHGQRCEHAANPVLSVPSLGTVVALNISLTKPAAGYVIS